MILQNDDLTIFEYQIQRNPQQRFRFGFFKLVFSTSGWRYETGSCIMYNVIDQDKFNFCWKSNEIGTSFQII